MFSCTFHYVFVFSPLGILHFLALLKAVWFSPCLQGHVLIPALCSGSTRTLQTWCMRCCREEFDPQEQEEGDWNLYWRSSAFRSSGYENVLYFQRLNHHPKTAIISREDCLAQNLRRMRGRYGPALYDFSPLAFILPNDYTRFLEEYEKNIGKRVDWICKPVDLSRGRGIFISENIIHLTYASPVIVQKYISNPFLICASTCV